MRVLYECLPLSWLIEVAGGKAISGRQEILDYTPTKLHDRVGIILGSKNDVLEILEFNTKFPINDEEEENYKENEEIQEQ